nr:MAG TPA: hypothetical protein [Caudoviricetes sp.]
MQKVAVLFSETAPSFPFGTEERPPQKEDPL